MTRSQTRVMALLACLVISTFAVWQGAGAQQSGDPIKPEHRNFWSFQPLSDPPTPVVRGEADNPIDAFLLARLEAQGLTYRAAADRKSVV